MHSILPELKVLEKVTLPYRLGIIMACRSELMGHAPVLSTCEATTVRPARMIKHCQRLRPTSSHRPSGGNFWSSTVNQRSEVKSSSNKDLSIGPCDCKQGLPWTCRTAESAAGNSGETMRKNPFSKDLQAHSVGISQNSRPDNSLPCHDAPRTVTIMPAFITIL